MKTWQIDVTAPNRTEAIRLIRGAPIPPFAVDHLAGIVAAEQASYYVNLYRPDGPMRVIGSGTDHGSYISLERASIESQENP